VARSNPQPQLFERRDRVGAPLLVDDGAWGLAVPVRAAEEVDEVEAERVFGLAKLPLLVASCALEVVAEAPNLVCQRLRRRPARQELADPPHDVRRRRLAGQTVLQDVLGELRQGVLGLAHGSLREHPVARLRPCPTTFLWFSAGMRLGRSLSGAA
jgi:hypothetical protein